MLAASRRNELTISDGRFYQNTVLKDLTILSFICAKYDRT